MKEKLLKLIKSKEEARDAAVAKSEKSQDVSELRSLNAQIESINKELTQLRAMVSDIETEERNNNPLSAAENQNNDDGIAARTAIINTADNNPPENRSKQTQYTPGIGFRAVPGGGMQTKEERAVKELADREKRGKELMEGRSITIATSGIVIPSKSGTVINPTFLQVSNLVDAVHVLPLSGGESFRQPYEMLTPDGTYTNEGADPADTDVAFGYADMNKTKIASYSEITEEIVKLPAADYESVVTEGTARSVRKKLAKEILIGDGSTGHLVGIFSSNANAIDAATDINNITAIDNTTLDNIIYSYGGVEAVDSMAALILNKKDLKAFSEVRTSTGQSFYKIVPVGNGNAGTINGIPYLINSACGALSDSKTAAATYCMAYGSLANYQLTVFSDLQLQRSTDYKFKEGMIAHRGVIFAGGNVVAYNGFLRVKTPGTAPAASGTTGTGTSGTANTPSV